MSKVRTDPSQTASDPADAKCFGHSAFAGYYAELRAFAAKNSQTVENDREKFSGPFKSLRGNPTPRDCIG